MTSTTKTDIPKTIDARILARIIEEGYGPGAWHGPDLRAAVEDVAAEAAFWRPAANRHNIAEIALHHAWCCRAVRAQLSGTDPEPFPLEGEDWFSLPAPALSKWPAVQAVLDREQDRLAATIAKGRFAKPDGEVFDLVLGITAHAIYHAGQIQLLKRLKQS